MKITRWQENSGKAALAETVKLRRWGKTGGWARDEKKGFASKRKKKNFRAKAQDRRDNGGGVSRRTSQQSRKWGSFDRGTPKKTEKKKTAGG